MKNSIIVFSLIFLCSSFAYANILCGFEWWNHEITNTFLEGSNVNEPCDNEGNTPLHSALSADYTLSREQYKAIAVVIDAGADLHAINELRQTPYSLARLRYQSFFLRPWIEGVEDFHCEGRRDLLNRHPHETVGERAIYTYIIYHTEGVLLEEAHDRVDADLIDRFRQITLCP